MPVATDLAQVLTDPASFATTLLAAVGSHYGPEMLGWDPRTLHLELEEDFHVTLPRPNFDRLMVGVALVKTDLFYHSLPDFIRFCTILSGSSYNPAHWDPADLDEIAWGVTEAAIIWPPDSAHVFTDDIRHYIGHMLDEEGIIHPPDILRLGLRDKDPSAIVNTYADDPQTLASIQQTEAVKTAGITRLVRAGLTQLRQQLAQLHLDRAGEPDPLSHTLRTINW